MCVTRHFSCQSLNVRLWLTWSNFGKINLCTNSYSNSHLHHLHVPLLICSQVGEASPGHNQRYTIHPGSSGAALGPPYLWDVSGKLPLEGVQEASSSWAQIDAFWSKRFIVSSPWMMEFLTLQSKLILDLHNLYAHGSYSFFSID